MQKVEISEEENFQNRVIRPRIKACHELLFKTLKEHINNENKRFEYFDDIQKVEFVSNCITKNMALKVLLRGIVLGGLEVDDYYKYFEINANDVNKRITKILIQRFQSNLAELI